MRKSIALILMIGLVAAASAETFGDKLNNANATLRSGNVDEALKAYRNLQIDSPESDSVYYNMGCAQYKNAEKQTAKGLAKDEKNPFEEARATFEKSEQSENPGIRLNGEFNAANCLAQTAIVTAKADDRDATINAFKNSIQAYEDFLRHHPGHDGAQTNLDHMRYLLKKMLQNPPKDQQQGGGKQQDKPQKDEQNKDANSQNGGGDQEKNKQSEPDKQESQQPDKPQDNQSAQAKQNDKGDRKQPEQGQDKDQQEANSNKNQTPSNQKGKPRSASARDQQATEALLQSLDDQDRKEQVEMRRAKPDTRIRGDWW